jgi:glycosyltransferase involved in cell wall biosynthesis
MSEHAASVVIPAHNEEAVLGRCLDALRSGARPGDFATVVVCNGCTDRTAEIARRAGVAVLETPRPGKAGALNIGDASVSAFPRFYIDADVRVTGDCLLAVAEVLRAGDALAAAPRLEVDLTGVSRSVRDYYRIWMRLDYVTSDHIGSGVVGLSEQGRGRFDRFPEAIADDYLLYSLFAPGERRTVPQAAFTVFPARTARDLVRRKSRVDAGNIEMRRRGLLQNGAGGNAATSVFGRADWLRAVRAEPRLAAGAPAYAMISVAAKLLARRKLRRGDAGSWERDESSRTVETR